VRAARLPLVGPDGERVVFGDVLNGGVGDVEVGNQSNADNARRRTLVVFLRHFWCPLCQDYAGAPGRACWCDYRDGDVDDA
jgi:hypothetical protein